MPTAHVEQVARRDSRRIVVVIFGAGAGICTSVEPYCDAGQLEVGLWRRKVSRERPAE